MTTIAYKAGILAADTQVTQDDVKYLSSDKITVISKDTVLAGAGDVGEILKLEKFFRDYPDWKENLDKKPVIKRSLDAILISNGKPYTIFKNDFPDLLGHPFIACGSGWKFAMAGMHMGLSAPDAVKLASEFDINTNDRIKYINVEDLAASTKTKRRAAKTAPPVPEEETGTGT